MFVDLQEALQKLNQILDEERAHPTTSYAMVTGSETLDALFLLTLPHLRSSRPRVVQEKPQHYKLESINYDLLRALFSHVDSQRERALVAGMLSRVSHPDSFRRTNASVFPSWYNYVSETPLVAEFCIRNRAKAPLFQAISESQFTLGLLLLLKQLEELLAFNFNLLTEEQLIRDRAMKM